MSPVRRQVLNSMNGDWYHLLKTLFDGGFGPRGEVDLLLIRVSITLELIWKARNDRLHGVPPIMPQDVSENVERMVSEYNQVFIPSLEVLETTRDWVPPPPGWTKISTATFHTDQIACLGALARNHEGKVLQCAFKCFASSDQILMEATSLLLGFQLATRLHLKYCIFESENSFIIDSVCADPIAWDVNLVPVLQSIRCEARLIHSWIVIRVDRDLNSLARDLVTWAGLYFWEEE